MTYFHLTLANTTFSVRPLMLLLGGVAGLIACALLFAYVAALQNSIERGQALHERQRSADAGSARTMGASAKRGTPSPKLIAASN
jgi:hypothetical protein